LAQAAQLRDELRRVCAADPLLAAQQRLDAAVKAERWDDAAAARDELRALQPLPVMVGCASSCVTLGVCVDVRSEYLPSRSDPPHAYLFRYFVRFVNEGAGVPVKLLRRHWYITDANGRTDEVEGEGVVGQTPTLSPGESYTYSSFSPLRTTCGTMRGVFTFAREDGVEIAAVCAPFALDVEGGSVPLPPAAGA
jgi:ApaG protein